MKPRFIKIFVAWIFLCQGSMGFCVPESEIVGQYDQIKEYVNSKIRTDDFIGWNKKRLHWGVIDGDLDLAPVVIVEGLGESLEYYNEMLFDLIQQVGNKRSIFIFDLRGQGFSERLSKHDGVIHINSFEDYVFDLEIFINKVVKPRNIKPPVLIAHSTGGLVALDYLSLHPDDADKILFLTPLFGFNYGNAPEWLMVTLAKLLMQIGYADKFVPFRQSSDFPPFAGNRLTSSEARFTNLKRVFSEQPKPYLSGPSVGFVRAAQLDLELLDSRLQKMTVPARVITAGDDAYVSTNQTEGICRKMPICKSIRIPNAKHVILHETDSVRSQVFKIINDWILN